MNIKPLTSNTRAGQKKVNHVKAALHFLHANNAVKGEKKLREGVQEWGKKKIHVELVSILVIPALMCAQKINIGSA